MTQQAYTVEETIPQDSAGFSIESWMGDNKTEFLLTNVGAPFIIGLAVGYFAKKVIKIALFIGGGAIVLLFVTEYYGFTSLSDDGLKQATELVTGQARTFGAFLVDRLNQISSKGVSAVGGFFVGLKFG